jgi:hypothetical protein
MVDALNRDRAGNGAQSSSRLGLERRNLPVKSLQLTVAESSEDPSPRRSPPNCNVRSCPQIYSTSSAYSDSAGDTDLGSALLSTIILSNTVQIIVVINQHRQRGIRRVTQEISGIDIRL